MIEERTKRDLEMAWHIAVLQRSDAKHFPKSASEMWRAAPTRTDVSDMAAVVDAKKRFGLIEKPPAGRPKKAKKPA